MVMEGITVGRVMCRRTCQLLAPSMRAASIMSSLTDWSPAM